MYGGVGPDKIFMQVCAAVNLNFFLFSLAIS